MTYDHSHTDTMGAPDNNLKLWSDDQGRLTCQLGDGPIHRDVLLRKAAPISDPDHYFVILDAHGQEICVVRDPRLLSPDAQSIVKSAMDRRYLSSQVTAVLSLRMEGEVCYFEAETSRGRREFVIANLHEGLRRFGDRKLLFLDVDGNRFEIDDVDSLDRRSVSLLSKVL